MSEKRAPEEAAGQPWLDALEARVEDAVERLGALAADNRLLRERVAELEARLLEAESPGAEPAGAEAEGGAPGAGGEEPAAWRRERAEIRRRVGSLAETLATLLADTDAPD